MTSETDPESIIFALQYTLRQNLGSKYTDATKGQWNKFAFNPVTTKSITIRILNVYTLGSNGIAELKVMGFLTGNAIMSFLFLLNHVIVLLYMINSFTPFFLIAIHLEHTHSLTLFSKNH